MNDRLDIYPKWTWLHAVVFWFLSLVLRRKVRRHVGAVWGGAELPESGPVVLIANHASYFDTFVICVLFSELFGRRVYVPTKVKAFKGWLQKLFHEAGGAIAIDHAQPDEAYRKIGGLLARGECVLIFPEGRRSEGQGLLPFSYGGFNLAVRCGVPVVPIALHGTARVLPKDRLTFVHGEQAYVEIGAPMTADDFRQEGDDSKQLAGRMRDFTRGWLEQRLALFTPASAVRSLDGARLAQVMERRTEALLENGIELVSRRDALAVKRGCEFAFALGFRGLALEVQYTRVFGFSILRLPKLVALVFLGKYQRLIRAGLAQQGDNPYLHYCMGQLHWRVPRLLGGNRSAAVTSFGLAYQASPSFGIDAAKYVVSYATALAKAGRDAEAKTLLTRHFAAAPGSRASGRELRRHERARALAQQLQANLDRDPGLNPVETP